MIPIAYIGSAYRREQSGNSPKLFSITVNNCTYKNGGVVIPKMRGATAPLAPLAPLMPQNDPRKALMLHEEYYQAKYVVYKYSHDKRN